MKYFKKFQNYNTYLSHQSELNFYNTPHISVYIDYNDNKNYLINYKKYVSPIIANNITYNSTSQELISLRDNTISIQYSLDNEEFTSQIPTAINAGTYTVYYIATYDNKSVRGNLEVSISKANPTIESPVANTLEFNNISQNLIIAGNTNFGTLQYSLDNINWSTSIPTATNIGTYTVYYKVIGDSNVNDSNTYSLSVSINSISANSLDILYSKSTGELKVDSTVLDASLGYTPIGICVAETGFFGANEKARFMSLKYMNYTTPETGSLSTQGMYWGNYGTDISTITNITTTHNGGSSYGYLTTSWQTQTSNLIPSVFDTNNKWNTSVLGTVNTYAVTDIDGKNKTNKILATATAQSNWRTDTSITNNSGGNYAPAACCCARYHTLGTSTGNWYLGAEGEMSMIIALRNDINTKLTQIAAVYANDSVSSLANDFYWSSTEYGSNTAYDVNTNSGYIRNAYKDNNYYVVAMLAV